jgi:hypothetical protein
MQDENYVQVALAKDTSTGLAVPIKCNAFGEVLAVSADDGTTDLPIVPPIKEQDENYVPIALGLAPDNTTRHIPVSSTGIVLTVET